MQALKLCAAGCDDTGCIYDEETNGTDFRCVDYLTRDVLELLKELDDRQTKWLETISDNQLSIGGADPLTDYEQGMWDGLQMAYEILTEEDSVK